MPTSRTTARRSVKATLVSLICLTLISMTGCAPRYVAVRSEDLVQVQKGELEQLHSDNELLIQALTECQGKR